MKKLLILIPLLLLILGCGTDYSQPLPSYPLPSTQLVTEQEVWVGPNQETETEYLGTFDTGEDYYLVNNPKAKDPTWDELELFLEEDKTELTPYEDWGYNCKDFAVDLHNRAEEQGLRTALVILEFSEPPGHALNAFKINSQDLIYVDCTGPENPDPDIPIEDAFGYIEVGKPYVGLTAFIAADYSELEVIAEKEPFLLNWTKVLDSAPFYVTRFEIIW